MTAAFTSYIEDVLGLRVDVEPASTLVNALPYFLHEAFNFARARLCGQDILLLIDKGGTVPTSSELRQWVDKAQSATGMPAVFVTQVMASHQRKRLIDQKVPFVVPGNQLYLPDLGLDLREYFKQTTRADIQALTPSAQLMLIHALLRGTAPGPWYPVEDLTQLGYAAMTVSRATRELVAAKLMATRKVGRELLVELTDAPHVLWERAQPLCKSPVQREVWVRAGSLQAAQGLPLAGESALSKLSMLNPPRHEVRAVYKQQWPTMKTQHELLPEQEVGAMLIQLWNYPPLHHGPAYMVDKLSLCLSLRDEHNDRIQMALDELKEALIW